MKHIIISLLGLLAISCTSTKENTTPDPEPKKDTTVVVKTAPVSIKGATGSWNTAIVEVKLTKDYGQKRTVGVKIGETLFFAKTQIAISQTTTLTIEGLAGQPEVEMTPFADYGQERIFGNPYTYTPAAEPQPITVQWTPVTTYTLPAGASLYKAETTATGAKVNMWYALVPSASAVKCVLESSVCTPESLAGKLSGPAIIINGGYFGAPSTSYSHLTTGGVRKAKNIASLTRTYSYAVTRPAFGVSAQGKPEICWIYDDASGTTSYPSPLPVVDGEASIPIADAGQGTRWTPTEAIGGAPVLLKNGHICFDFLKTDKGYYVCNHDLLQADIFKEGLKAPRTAIGYKADGSVVLFVCDGRNSGGSAGLTLDELAAIMRGLGCTDAMNLDGGGSTAICVKGAGVLNKPSDGSSRKVLTFVTIQ